MLRRLTEKHDKNGRRIRIGRPIEYTEQELHDWLYSKFDGKIVRCPYSNKLITFDTCDIDHKIPLSRGGTASLDNLVACDPEANQEKGKLTGPEYFFLVAFLEKYFTPVARNDIRGRLKKAVRLAASVNWHRKKFSSG